MAASGKHSSTPFRPDGAARCRRRWAVLKKAAAVAAGTMEEKMRVLSHFELQRLSRNELMVIQRQILSELTALPEGSPELRNAHHNLHNIRKEIARPDFRPR
jgi:hypothetical protein